MRLTPTIRRETSDDVSAIHAVVRAAFGRPNEANLVAALRRADALPVSAIAVLGDRLIGHMAFSHITIGEELSGLALAPVAVQPECQRQGIGTALVRWGLDEIRSLGHRIVIVLGSPAYYGRFGFMPASQFGIVCPFPVSAEDFMLLELSPGAAAGCGGTVCYRPEFELI
jgi:putative acetyltransferase